MIAASEPVHRPASAKLACLNRNGTIEHRRGSDLLALLRPGDLVIANDAATLPASLSGTHDSSGANIEVRLAGRRSLDPWDVQQFAAIVFGSGDFRTRTEDRPLPPAFTPGDELTLGPLRAVIVAIFGHPRFLSLQFEGSPSHIWEGLVHHGRPIQYSHVPQPLAVWDTWTRIAGPPVAFEPPSAGFLLDWDLIGGMRRQGIGFATLTHAAGISSTGDPAMDARLPLDEPYRIPNSTAVAIRDAQNRGARIVAIGTTVVRALEHAALPSGCVPPGEGIATQRIGPGTRLQVVDAILSGTHEKGTSHYELLRAFAQEQLLERLDEQLESHGYRTHEFGDSILVEEQPRRLRVVRGGGTAFDAAKVLTPR